MSYFNRLIGVVLFSASVSAHIAWSDLKSEVSPEDRLKTVWYTDEMFKLYRELRYKSLRFPSTIRGGLLFIEGDPEHYWVDPELAIEHVIRHKSYSCMFLNRSWCLHLHGVTPWAKFRSRSVK